MSELDPVLLRAFSAARAERPRSGKGKAQTLAALGLSSSSAHASPRASAAAASGSRHLSSWPWWTIGVALVAMTGAVLRTTEEPAPAPAVVNAPAAPLATSTADTIAAPVLTVDQLPNAAEPPSVTNDTKPAEATKAAASTARRPASRPVLEPGSQALASESLRDEVEAIERASRALSQRRCALARSHLSAYNARFPNGKLRREAEVVAIEIAGRSGQADQARTAARSFVAQFPDTPYALRLAPWLRDGARRSA